MHQINPLLSLALLLLISMAASDLVRRWRLPSMTGQILVGVLIGPSALALFDHAAVDGLLPVTNFALGLIAVAVGHHLQWPRLRIAARRLLLLVTGEIVLVPALVFAAVLLGGGQHWSLGLLLGTMSIATAPATIVTLVKETRARGIFVKTLVAAVALNNLACIVLFELALAATRAELSPEGAHHPLLVLAAPLRQLVLSLLLGGGIGLLLTWLTRHVVRSDRLATASLTAILGTIGLSTTLGVSPLLSCLMLGVALANLEPEKEEIGHRVFANFEGAILAVFFTVAGMELNFAYLAPAGLLALLVVVGRAAAKTGAAWLAMTLADAPRSTRLYLGPALVPQAGVAVGLLLLVRQDPSLAVVRDILLAVGLTTVTLNELIGPLLTRLALQRSGEAGRDRPHLIDFLREECITTDLTGPTLEEAVDQLVGMMVRSCRLGITPEELTSRILERERSMSTCVGNGLAIPHCLLDEDIPLSGVLGISRRGLAAETPDGQPLHCVVVIVAPRRDGRRYLEVLAALSRTIGTDRDLQAQLYHARSPAHAYEILHAEEFEDLDDLLESSA